MVVVVDLLALFVVFAAVFIGGTYHGSRSDTVDFTVTY